MTILASDNFNRPDAATLGANFATITSEVSLKIVGNQACISDDTAANGNRHSAIVYADDQYSEGTILATVAGGNITLLARCAAAARTHYRGGTGAGSWPDQRVSIAKRVAGVFTNLANAAAYIILPNDRLKLEVVGTSVILKQFGVTRLSVTDATITTGSPGLDASCPPGTGNIACWDNWEAGNFSAAPPAPVHYVQVLDILTDAENGTTEVRYTYDDVAYAIVFENYARVLEIALDAVPSPESALAIALAWWLARDPEGLIPSLIENQRLAINFQATTQVSQA